MHLDIINPNWPYYLESYLPFDLMIPLFALSAGLVSGLLTIFISQFALDEETHENVKIKQPENKSIGYATDIARYNKYFTLFSILYFLTLLFFMHLTPTEDRYIDFSPPGNDPSNIKFYDHLNFLYIFLYLSLLFLWYRIAVFPLKALENIYGPESSLMDK